MNRCLSQHCCHCSLCLLTLLWRHSAPETRCFLGSSFLYTSAHASWPSTLISECFSCLTWWPSSCSLTPFSKAQLSGSGQVATQRSGQVAKSVADFKDYSEDYHPEKLLPYRVTTLGLASWYFDPSSVWSLQKCRTPRSPRASSQTGTSLFWIMLFSSCFVLTQEQNFPDCL